MSVGTIAYAVDLDRLRAAFGSNDPGLLAALTERFDDHIRDTEEFSAEGHPWFRDALADLIAGTIRHPERSAFHAWAAELLCLHLGATLDDKGLVGALDGLGLDHNLATSGPPLPIPPRDEPPRLGHLTAAEVAEAACRLDPDTPEADDARGKARAAVRSWLRQAAARGQALVTVTH